MNKKKLLILIISITIIIIVVSIFIVTKKSKINSEQSNHEIKIVTEIQPTTENYIGELSDGSKINTNAKMNEPKTVGDYELSNIRLTLKNGITTFRANVTNKSENKKEFKGVTLVLLDENGKELVSAKGLIPEVNANESTELSISITSNYIKAYEYKVIED